MGTCSFWKSAGLFRSEHRECRQRHNAVLRTPPFFAGEPSLISRPEDGHLTSEPKSFQVGIGLTLNLKTAKALGLTIPETLLATADEVIQ